MEYGWRGSPSQLPQQPGPVVNSNTAVQRLLQEQQQGKADDPQSFTARLEPRRRPQFEWPPRRTVVPQEARVRTLPPLPASNTGLKKVTWPPPPEDIADGEQEPVYAQEAPAVNGFVSPVPQYAQQVSRPGRSPLQQQPPQQPQQLPQTPPAHRRSGSRDRRSPAWTPPPTFITLRQSPPIHQEPAPVVVSQPATAIMQGGVRARGDAKWPPQEYKSRADEENAQRLALAKGPVCRPRLPKRDYTSFFDQNRVNAMYPGYRAPPGTQHYVDETGVSEF
ncbi:hepatocyte growth factor-regulated tyrosine kinase substrate-like isoform X3 [Frankliniella occidentalis]|uniref:Hepatocyte growth factor-regulated tyrosine kinase substrate-like isoform X3 n=1 Tax=Frankliniella occidentalis TaxID=133901 RepID=A0A9C6TNK6_FRAOC|nr:hepatocyte growth factor-regulated tyrosine kinase substrate-like isoform X3 [Frankliniella occidentalis]